MENALKKGINKMASADDFKSILERIGFSNFETLLNDQDFSKLGITRT